MSKLYLPSGYLNWEWIFSKLRVYPYCFIVGGRGTGKTYGLLEYLVEHNLFFNYMRRLQKQVDKLKCDQYQPFKKLNLKRGWSIYPFTSEDGAVFYEASTNEKGKRIQTGDPFGYMMALSTLSNFRGGDISDIDISVLDEFIPEKHERKIPSEGFAFLNAIETIARNRELEGEDPMPMICLANANDMANAIFLELGLVKIAQHMKMTGQELYFNKDRRLMIIYMEDSPISRKKKKTSLYQLAGGDSDFSKMAADNEFIEETSGQIKSMRLAEYSPIVAIGGICIYRHKSNNTYYISEHISGSVPVLKTTEIDRTRLRRSYIEIWWKHLERKVWFENRLCEILFIDYYK